MFRAAEYNRIAQLLREAPHREGWLEKHPLVEKFCAILERDNPKFSRLKFVEACYDSPEEL